MDATTLQLRPRRLTGPARVELRSSCDTRARRWLLVVIVVPAAGTVALGLFTGGDALSASDHLQLSQLVTGPLPPVPGVLVVPAVAVVRALLVTDGPADWSSGAAEVGGVVLQQLVHLLSGVASGMLPLSSPRAIVTCFVLPTVSTVVVSEVAAPDWAGDWFDLTAGAPLSDGGTGRPGMATTSAL